ncbi:MAG: hypothetical protein J1E78_00515 [Muribaculaceae bacterium]|nr:hypothetical protein [Muribaculaceae bacterium]
MDQEDIKKENVESAEEKKVREAKEAIQEETQEEIRNFAETQPNTAPNAFWNQSGTWWIIGIAGILIIFLVIWVCFFS